MDGVVARMRLGPSGHLGQAILPATDQLDLDTRTDAIHQFLVIGHRGIDERHFLSTTDLGRVGDSDLDRGRDFGDRCPGRNFGDFVGDIDGGGAVEHHARLQGHDQTTGQGPMAARPLPVTHGLKTRHSINRIPWRHGGTPG
ncbi:MAG: hypothetical protein H7840_10615 [Alphaproteobacteria bacterium]